MKINIVGTFVLMLLCSVVFTPKQAQALSCSPQSLEDDAHAAVAIFLGTAQSVTDNGYTAEILVEKSWKGGARAGKTVKVVSDKVSIWGLSFQKDRRYLIFTRHRSPYRIEVCGRSKEIISQAAIDNAKTENEKANYTAWMQHDDELLNGSGPNSLNSLSLWATAPGTSYVALMENTHPVTRYAVLLLAIIASAALIYYVYKKRKGPRINKA